RPGALPQASINIAPLALNRYPAAACPPWSLRCYYFCFEWLRDSTHSRSSDAGARRLQLGDGQFGDALPPGRCGKFLASSSERSIRRASLRTRSTEAFRLGKIDTCATSPPSQERRHH